MVLYILIKNISITFSDCVDFPVCEYINIR